MKTAQLALALLGLCSTTLTATAFQNIINNAGFESGNAADANDWYQLAGPAGSTSRSSDMPNSGNFHALIEIDHVNNPAAGAAYFFEQVQPVGSIDNTLNYDLSFTAKSGSMDFIGIDMFYQILWLDQDASHGGGVRGETLTYLTSAGINTEYQSFTLLDMDVPDGTDSFMLRFQLSAGAVDNIANSLYIDDVSLSAIPSPASASLLALAGLAVTRRRR